jgi:hypothetical protein
MTKFKSLAIGLSFVFILASMLPADARPRIKGDWISSGAQADIIMSNPPAYDFAYTCQVELTDGREHGADGAILLAIATFDVDAEHYGSVLGKDLHWDWSYLTADGTQVNLKSKPKRAFGTADHIFALDIVDPNMTETVETDDTISIMAQLGLRFGSYVYPKAQWSEDITRQDDGVVVTNSLTAYSDSGKVKSIQVYMQCDKVR